MNKQELFLQLDAEFEKVKENYSQGYNIKQDASKYVQRLSHDIGFTLAGENYKETKSLRILAGLRNYNRLAAAYFEKSIVERGNKKGSIPNFPELKAIYCNSAHIKDYGEYQESHLYGELMELYTCYDVVAEKKISLSSYINK